MPEHGIKKQGSVSDEIQSYAEILSRPSSHELIYAHTQFQIIKKHIQNFQKFLDAEHDVGLLLTSFGQSVLMEVTEIGYEDPVLMVFRGYVNGCMSTLIQHINQLNFLLTSVPKEPDKPKREIGFTANWAAQ